MIEAFGKDCLQCVSDCMSVYGFSFEYALGSLVFTFWVLGIVVSCSGLFLAGLFTVIRDVIKWFQHRKVKK